MPAARLALHACCCRQSTGYSMCTGLCSITLALGAALITQCEVVWAHCTYCCVDYQLSHPRQVHRWRCCCAAAAAAAAAASLCSLCLRLLPTSEHRVINEPQLLNPCHTAHWTLCSPHTASMLVVHACCQAFRWLPSQSHLHCTVGLRAGHNKGQAVGRRCLCKGRHIQCKLGSAATPTRTLAGTVCRASCPGWPVAS
jgi:hypothetical protein